MIVIMRTSLNIVKQFVRKIEQLKSFRNCDHLFRSHEHILQSRGKGGTKELTYFEFDNLSYQSFKEEAKKMTC